MATQSELAKLTLQGTGENDNTWGQVLNTNFQLLEQLAAGTENVVLTSIDVVLSDESGDESQARSAVLNLQGSLSANVNVIVPSRSKLYYVANNTIGAFTVTLRTAAGTGASIPQGASSWIYSDGTDVTQQLVSDTVLVGGVTPGNVINRDVDPASGSGLLDRDSLDARYILQINTVAGFTTGDTKITFKTNNDIGTGWIVVNDGSIGPSGSGATTRADNDTEALYTLIWNNVPDAYAPVGGLRGASAGDDWLATKPLFIPKMLGRTLGVAGSGDGLSSREIGQDDIGTETHRLTEVNLPEHSHRIFVDETGTNASRINTTPDRSPNYQVNAASDNDYAIRGSSPADPTVGLTGTAGDPVAATFNIMQPTTFLNIAIKL